MNNGVDIVGGTMQCLSQDMPSGRFVCVCYVGSSRGNHGISSSTQKDMNVIRTRLSYIIRMTIMENYNYHIWSYHNYSQGFITI